MCSTERRGFTRDAGLRSRPSLSDDAIASARPARVIEFDVQQVPVERIFALRKRVLRPHLGEDVPFLLADDLLPTTIAYAAVTPDGRVLAVGRLNPEPPPFAPDEPAGWRLRAMAADPAVRGLGVGSAVLGAIIGHVKRAGGGMLWCNARLAARTLYERAGLRARGDVWEEPDIGPHILMWMRVG
jgi:GNAT superfamily N-acetyltransferase